ncbi:MAG: RES family NAD+ phosphorylase [Candidatus Binataceae bacterium]
MTVWRLCRRAFAALDGEGARLYGGRWNSPGHSIVYTSQNLSLAVLQIIVHLELPPERLPPDYVKIEIQVPDEVSSERCDRLPSTASAMLELGTRWYQTAATAALLVPSVIVPEERNLLLNPGHRDFAKVRAARPRPFGFDSRLFAR